MTHSCAQSVDLQANVNWPALAALESGSTFSAVQALNINEGAFNEYSQVNQRF